MPTARHPWAVPRPRSVASSELGRKSKQKGDLDTRPAVFHIDITFSMKSCIYIQPRADICSLRMQACRDGLVVLAGSDAEKKSDKRGSNRDQASASGKADALYRQGSDREGSPSTSQPTPDLSNPTKLLEVVGQARAPLERRGRTCRLSPLRWNNSCAARAWCMCTSQMKSAYHASACRYTRSFQEGNAAQQWSRIPAVLFCLVQLI